MGYAPTLGTDMGDLQERITSTKSGSTTSMQAVYVPADDYTDLAPRRPLLILTPPSRCSARWPTRVFSRPWTLGSTSRILDLIVGVERYHHRPPVQQTLQRYRDLQDIIAILGVEELMTTKLILQARARFSASNVANVCGAQFTGRDGRHVKVEETVRGFREVLDGKHDDLPEQAFYLVGTIEEAVETAAQLRSS